MLKIRELLDEGTITDPFFDVLNDSTWNACIGVQSNEQNYVDGYLHSAQLIIDTLIRDKMFGSRDTLAMPILYNARHGLELALKFVLSLLVEIDMASARVGSKDHDIAAYWHHLSQESIGDKECRDQIALLEPFVKSLAQIDVDGQELRYFENLDGKRSLEDHTLLSLRLVRESIVELREILEQLIYSAIRLSRENITKVRTKECSRLDLTKIAQIVGARATWSEDSFSDRKAKAQANFKLSGRAFSRALDTIQKSRELSAIIGIEAPLLYLNNDKICKIVALWLEVNPPQAYDALSIGIEITRDSWGDWERESRARLSLNKTVEQTLSVEEFADMETIFYIGRDNYFGEEYEEHLEDTINSHRRRKDRLTLIDHILVKQNFVEDLAAGLSRVGQTSLATEVQETLEEAIKEKI